MGQSRIAIMTLIILSLAMHTGCVHPEIDHEESPVAEEAVGDEIIEEPQIVDHVEEEPLPDIAESPEPPSEQPVEANVIVEETPAPIVQTAPEPVLEPEADDRPLPLESAATPAPAEEAIARTSETPESHPGRFARLTKECAVHDEPQEESATGSSLPNGWRLWTEPVEGGEWRKVYRRAGVAYIKDDCFMAVIPSPVAQIASVAEPPQPAPTPPAPEPTPEVVEAPVPQPPPVAAVSEPVKAEPPPQLSCPAVPVESKSTKDDWWLTLAPGAAVFLAAGAFAYQILRRPRRLRDANTMA